jgi:CRP-like cAMP-binding protein
MVPVSLLGQGKCFGELALEIDEKNPGKIAKRQASILCTEPCEFAIISKEDYNASLKIID